MTVQKPKTQAEAAIMRVKDEVLKLEEDAQKCHLVAHDNENHEEHFAYTEGLADMAASAAERMRAAIGIAVWTRLERVPTAIEPTAAEEEDADE